MFDEIKKMRLHKIHKFQKAVITQLAFQLRPDWDLKGDDNTFLE